MIGGRSSRMGQPKHLITDATGKTWVEHTSSLLTPYVDEVVLSGKGEIPESVSHLQRLTDIEGVKGPLTGILAAMRWQPKCCWLLLACDMPHIEKAALQWLLSSRSPSSHGTVPRLTSDGFYEPLLALYEPKAKDYFEEMAQAKMFRISQIAKYATITTPVVPAELAKSWQNINTPEQLQSAGLLLD